MNSERLLRLADHLDTVPPENFKITVWKCDTVACAIGHAVSIFHEEGLHLFYPEDYRFILIPRYKNQVGLEAVASFFDITEDDAEDLFTYRGIASRNWQETYLIEDITPKLVAKVIRDFCDTQVA